MDKYLLPIDDGLPVRQSGDWAQDKLFYVKHYIDTFEKSMREKPWRARIYIDLFSGPGKCQDRETGAYFLGSPLLALTTEHLFTKYFFVDLDAGNLEALQIRSGATTVQQDRIRFLVGDANEKVLDITSEISHIDKPYVPGVWNALSLAFLDPNGVEELKWDIASELAQMKKMDLIIHYSQQGVERLVKRSVGSQKETALDTYFPPPVRWGLGAR
ncbi:MAG: three-Cys-motif partner protein TcmP [Chloroflexota bacterium]